jgi:sulfur relay (sulfurtransferase) complex TusBCD TusD component (DsrE family)
MKLAMVISQTNPELVFNAFRLANFSRKEGDEVKVFLLAEGSELCPLSTMKDLYTLIRDADRVVTF